MRGAVSVQSVRKTYGDVVALERVSLDVKKDALARVGRLRHRRFRAEK
jgi:ABC-type Fe3+/spermidine/putrescine transport system ATPase subunit